MQEWEVLRDMQENKAVYVFTAKKLPKHMKPQRYRYNGLTLQRFDYRENTWSSEGVYLPISKGLGTWKRESIEEAKTFDYSEGWHPNMSVTQTKDLAYWERNMLALAYANRVNQLEQSDGLKKSNGWYEHPEEGFEGWRRIISLDQGTLTFHVPDDFDLGTLPKIQANWDGHSTFEKWDLVMDRCGVKKKTS